ncbi:MAG: phosphohydrolase [Bacteroidetes bacterium B1(2017)]|nr:MAG: phosphohydrolase [Bacteroidetes bacterium B1(2017)]
MNKLKNFNDPVYGFVSIPCDLVYDVIAHPHFQRLRRIKQLGLSNYVYPGAQHTRFQHVIGAMSLTQDAVQTLEQKGIEISQAEKEAVYAAILLHDIGHGPFSHTLENVLIQGMHHEAISLHLMNVLNQDLGGRLTMAIQVFTNTYPRKFLHQLVSSQLDMDRLDYLRRDSFYSGVQEGVVGQDRIIKMLNVQNDELVVDEKGIYSIEKFLIARRLMYWQVYLHKTVVAAETVLVKTIEHACILARRGEPIFASPSFAYFLQNELSVDSFFTDPEAIKQYTLLDDDDVMSAIKVWCSHADIVLSTMATILKDRLLPKVELSNEPFDALRIQQLKQQVMQQKGITEEEAGYFVFTDSVKNRAYNLEHFNIKILFKNGQLLDIAKASDQLNIEALTKSVTKYFLCYPKNLG